MCKAIYDTQVGKQASKDNEKALQGLLALIDTFQKDVDFVTARPEPPVIGTDNPKLDAALLFIATHLFVRTEDLLTLAGKLLPTWAKEKPYQECQQNFLCYRYDVRPGYIAKSFTSVSSPTAEAPFCRFKNFYKDDRKRRREVTGVILPTRAAIYFLGQVDGGTALKVMAFKNRDNPQDIYEGLLLSYSDYLLASRIVMVPTNVADHNAANIGVFKVQDLKDEVASFRNDLKNYIRFTFEKPIYRNRKEINQADMVAFVNERMTEKGEPMLTFKDGKPFRPAATEHYTFNSALRLRTTSEPQED